MNTAAPFDPSLTAEPPVFSAGASVAVPDQAPLVTLEKSPEERARETAFRADPFHWTDIKGQQYKLHPFARGRESFLHQHREALHCPPFHECIGTANAFMADTARILWLLTRDPVEWLDFIARSPTSRWDESSGRPVRIPLNPHVALEQKITTWADEHMTADIQGRVDDYELVYSIIDRSRATRATPKNDATETAPGNAPGQ